MIIRNAKIEDTSKILEIYESAIVSLKEMGVNQWQDGNPSEESLMRDIEDDISRVCEDDGIVIATAAAYIGHENTYDKIYEGKWLTDNTKYGIIHRIAVSNSAKKGGIASFIMDYTAALAKKSGVTSLRCDTHKDNLIMQKTLKKSGYIYCGTIVIDDGTERLAFERVI